MSTAPVSKRNYLLWLGIPVSAAVGASYYQSYTTKNNLTIPTAYSPAMDGTWRDFVLKEVIRNNHNVSTFRFSLPTGSTELGLPTASSLVAKFTIPAVPGGIAGFGGVEEKNIIRPYTPIEPDTHNGTFDLVVKVYKDGKMSSHIHALQPGDKLAMKGPNLKYPYKPNTDKHIGLIAGGSGLTPMYQLVQKIALDPNDTTKVDLIFANADQKDIFLAKELDAFAALKPNQIKIHYSWTGLSGYITKETIQKYFPAPGAGKVMVCGPPPMYAAISGAKAKDYTQGEVGGLLKDMNYTSSDVFKF